MSPGQALFAALNAFFPLKTVVEVYIWQSL